MRHQSDIDMINTNKELIDEHEQAFAFELSAGIFEKPRMTVWMILIPIFIVYHIFRHNRYVDGRRQFTEHYLSSRRHALDAAARVAADGGRIDFDDLAKRSNVPEHSIETFSAWMQVLAEHYTALLTASGESAEDLVRSAYQNRTNYLLTLNRLNQTESSLNTAIKSEVAETSDGVDEVIAKMEFFTENMRREMADQIFH